MKIKNRVLLLTFMLLLFIGLDSCKEKDKDPEVPAIVEDIEGNKYNIVTIGTQVWMKENLKVTSYNTGNKINKIENNASWETDSAGAWSDFDNETANGDTFGHLYNWCAVNHSEKICPDGWRVPNQNDWDVLRAFAGADSLSGAKLKEEGNTHWKFNGVEATNETGFTALPGGIRGVSGFCYFKNELATFWSSELKPDGKVMAYMMNYNTNNLFYSSYPFRQGMSVRCIKK